MKKIIITGGYGRFANILKKHFYGSNIFFLSKKEFNILNLNKITNYIKKKKIDVVVHCAGLSRPMGQHEIKISESILLNIVGTSNVVMACKKNNCKIIYLSTNLVYPCINGNYNESDFLLPFNNYGWSKLGGEAAVQMYKNSLILRVCMTEKPFLHNKAFSNVLTNFLYHDDFAKFFFKLINKKGIINIGGKTQTVYDFVKKDKIDIKTTKAKIKNLNQSMNVNKFFKIIKDK